MSAEQQQSSFGQQDQEQGGQQNQQQDGQQDQPQSGQQNQQQGDQQGQQQGGQQQSQGVGLPEWISFGIGFSIVLALVLTLTILHFSNPNGPPGISITPQMDQIRQEQGGYYLPIQVENTGGKTAEDITVQVVLQPQQGASETLSFTVRFLSPEEKQVVTLIFRQDPAQGQLRQVVGFKTP